MNLQSLARRTTPTTLAPRWTLALLPLAALVASCNGIEWRDSTFEPSAGGAGGAGNGAGPGQGAGGEIFEAGPAGSGSGGLDPDTACATSGASATLVPVNMFIMFDKSGSMDDDGKWPAAAAALNAFFQDPGTAGLRVALRFFPDDGCDQNSCNVAVCSQFLVPLGPLTVDPAPADAQEQALIAAVNAHSPSGYTPMHAALAGAEQTAMALQAANPAEKTVVVLVTDGEPNGCDESIDNIAALAANALAAGVSTYTVGLEGSNEAQMNQIAQAGGSTQGYFVGNGNAQADLLAALKAIQGSAIQCAFQIPAPPSGEELDPGLVEVSYQPGDGSSPSAIAQVPTAADCGAGAGWYYDNPDAPTSITLCPASCVAVQQDDGAEIDILFGCAADVIH